MKEVYKEKKEKKEIKENTGQQGLQGEQGQQGIQGIQGEPGKGVPSGGTSGQALFKKTNNDYDTEWKNISGGQQLYIHNVQLQSAKYFGFVTYISYRSDAFIDSVQKVIDILFTNNYAFLANPLGLYKTLIDNIKYITLGVYIETSGSTQGLYIYGNLIESQPGTSVPRTTPFYEQVTTVIDTVTPISVLD